MPAHERHNCFAESMLFFRGEKTGIGCHDSRTDG